MFPPTANQSFRGPDSQVIAVWASVYETRLWAVGSSRCPPLSSGLLRAMQENKEMYIGTSVGVGRWQGRGGRSD